MRNEDKLVLEIDSIDHVSLCGHEQVVRLARLAMLIECEGCITIGMSPPTKTRNRPSLSAVVHITNTAHEIVEEAAETFKAEGIGFGARPVRPCAGVGHKPRFDVYVHGFVRVDTALRALLPYLRSKKRQAELVLEFIASRRAADPKAAYSDREWQITTEVRLLNSSQPKPKAIAKAKAYLELPESARTARATLYFRKYVEMCTTLQDAL